MSTTLNVLAQTNVCRSFDEIATRFHVSPDVNLLGAGQVKITYNHLNQISTMEESYKTLRSLFLRSYEVAEGLCFL